VKLNEILGESDDDVIRIKIRKPIKAEIDSFMKEFMKETEQHPFDRNLRLWNDLIGLTVYPSDNRIHIGAIMNFDEKNQGKSSLALKWLCDLADKYSVFMELAPVPIKNAGSKTGKNLTKAQLTSWYKRNGFTIVEHSILMRKPVKT
jgi:hypothetical protein